MAIDWGFNFRFSVGFVTDGANEAFIDEFQYPHTYTIGGSSVVAGYDVTNANTRDRNSGIDRRLAGIHFYSVVNGYFQIDLPSAGSYDIHLAAGDASASNPTAWDILDNNTVLHSVTGTAPTNGFYDANNNDYSAANWPGSETALTLSFATTTFKLVVRTGSQNNVIAHLRIKTGAAAPSQVPYDLVHSPQHQAIMAM